MPPTIIFLFSTFIAGVMLSLIISALVSRRSQVPETPCLTIHYKSPETPSKETLMPSPPLSNRDRYGNSLYLYADDDTTTELEDRIDKYSEGDESPCSSVAGVVRIFGVPIIYTPALDGLGGQELPDDIVITRTPPIAD